MSRDLSIRKQDSNSNALNRSKRYFCEAIDCGFIPDLKMYSVSQGEIITARDLSCNVVMKNIKEYFWLRMTRHDHMYGLIRDDRGYIYFKLTLVCPDHLSPKMKVYFSSNREDLISTAMSKRAYENYIKDTKTVLETIHEE
jgi:hypothetical protein